MKKTRSHFLRVIQTAYRLNRKSQDEGIPLDELIQQEKEVRAYSRRKFIGDAMKAGAALAIPSLFQSYTLPKKPAKDGVTINIVGAGIAGLYAGHLLKKAGYRANIYEASTRIGGRMLSGQNVVAEKTTTELGGEFIDSDHKDILRLCREFELPLMDTYQDTEGDLIRDAFYFEGRFYSEEDVIHAFSPFAKRMSTDIDNLPGDISYQHQEASAIDRTSIADYLRSIGMNGWLYGLFAAAYIGEYGLAAEEQSALNLLWLFDPNTKKGFRIFGESDERYKIIGGNDQLPKRIAGALEGQIQLEHRLTSISQNGNQYRIRFENGNESVSDYLLLALPFTILREVDFQVEMPKVKRRCIDELGYGQNSKLFLGFNSRPWRAQGYQGFTFNDLFQCSWESSQLQNKNTGPASYTIYLGGQGGVDLHRSQGEHYLMQMSRIFPDAQKEFNGKVSVYNWVKSPFVKGSYTCYRPGQVTEIGGAEDLPVGNIFFAGEHCSFDYQGFMNGAAETGRKAVKKILKRIR